jgi:hypothetical protein
MVLHQFGLIEVNEQERHEDGRIVGFIGETERRPHDASPERRIAGFSALARSGSARIG